MTPVRRRMLVWLAATASIALTVSLGCWQLRRADQKRAAYAELQSRQHLRPWSNADWPCAVAPDDHALPQQRPVRLTGHWLAQRDVYLDNRPMDGASGFIVVTPLRLTTVGGSACADRVVLVQRGWVPRNAHERLQLPAVPTPEGEVQVVGRVLSSLSQAYQLGDEAVPLAGKGPLVRQNANAAFWSSWLGQAPLVGAVLQVQAEDPAVAASMLRRHWPEPGQGQDKHLAYAAQWFAMAGVIAALTLWFQVIRPRRSSSPTPHVHA
jgi:surfeit locus 1 family protein